MRIFLIGYMGSGKSTLGRQLASELSYKFIDLDEYIQQMTGQSITTIFRDQGEEHFRVIEAELLRRIVEDDVVVATGGGCPVHHNNMDWIRKNGVSIYLKIGAKEAYDRLKNARSDRPLLKGLSEKSLLIWIEEQMQQREEFYAKADFTVGQSEAKVELLLQLGQSR